SALTSALKSLAAQPSQNVQKWIEETLKPKFKKGESLETMRLAAGSTASAPALQLSMLDGKTVSLASLSSKLVLLYVWSPNSTLSKFLLSDLQLLNAKYRARGVSMIALDVEDGLKTVRQSPDEYAYGLTFAAASPAAVQDYQICLLPSVILIKDGKVVYRQFGYSREFLSQLETALQEFLSEPTVSNSSTKERAKKR
ncbi:MAG: TlpA family protein disulfide reductase, partial [Chloroherpetonaceae bacterium]|nr:TlpA family protein disulfide reductase [Chloroherpetonaceae bacterium]